MALRSYKHTSYGCPNCNYSIYIPYPDPIGCLKVHPPICPHCRVELEERKIEISSSIGAGGDIRL
jgi:hypothetical protein